MIKTHVEAVLLHFKKLAAEVVVASNGSILKTFLVIFVAYFVFNSVEAMIEKLIWGERFAHWLDIVFISMFVWFALYAVRICAAYNIAINGIN